MLGPVSHAHRRPHVEVFTRFFRPEFLVWNGYHHQLSSVAVCRSTSHGTAIQDGARGRVQRDCSQHCSPRWRQGPCAKRLLITLQSRMAPGAVCKETAHNTAVQDGARGRVQRLPSLALPSGALCSRYWVDQKVCSIQEYLFNNSFPGGSKGKAPACNAGDPGSIPGLGSSPGKRNGNPLQYSCLENPLDGRAWWATVHGVAKSQTRLSE